jgi:hypothetical protein
MVPLALLLLHDRTSTLMADAGHSLAHIPQPTHFSSVGLAKTPLTISIAPVGQTSAQVPQATHILLSTTA